MKNLILVFSLLSSLSYAECYSMDPDQPEETTNELQQAYDTGYEDGYQDGQHEYYEADISEMNPNFVDSTPEPTPEEIESLQKDFPNQDF